MYAKPIFFLSLFFWPLSDHVTQRQLRFDSKSLDFANNIYAFRRLELKIFQNKQKQIGNFVLCKYKLTRRQYVV